MNDPKHYRLIKRSARKFAARYESWLNQSDLDEIASAATLYFVKCWNSSRIPDAAKRMNVAAARAARRAVCEFWDSRHIGQSWLHSSENDALDQHEATTAERSDRLPAMLARLSKDKYRQVAIGLAAGQSWEETAEFAGYKSGISKAVQRIRVELADYRPECCLMRAVREGLEACL